MKAHLTTTEQLDLIHKTEPSQQVLNDQLNVIVEVAKIDSGELKVRLGSISVRDAIEDIIEKFDLLSIKVGQTIRTHKL